MKALVYTECGPPDVLQPREVEKPTLEDDEVLIRVHAASINASDMHFLRGEPFLARMAFGLTNPKCTIVGNS